MTSSADLRPANGSYLLNFFRSQLFVKGQPPPEDLDLTGQTAIISGSNSGLGLECSRILLAHRLSKIILAVRVEQKGHEVASELRKKHPSSQIEVWSLDMLSYPSIEAFAKRCRSLERIDFVILNAGVTQHDFRINKSTGFEDTFQVNYLSTVLLTLLLLPVLKKKRANDQPSRITLVSSSLANNAKFPEQDADPLLPAFNDATHWNTSVAVERYNTSKLLCDMFVAKLKDLVDAQDVVVNLVKPGMIQTTGLDRSVSSGAKHFLIIFRRLFARTVQFGAWTYIDAALIQGPQTHGCVLDDFHIAPYPFLLYSTKGKSLIERLWNETLASFESAGIRDIGICLHGDP